MQSPMNKQCGHHGYHLIFRWARPDPNTVAGGAVPGTAALRARSAVLGSALGGLVSVLHILSVYVK